MPVVLKLIISGHNYYVVANAAASTRHIFGGFSFF
jgi:hypothetical protein